MNTIQYTVRAVPAKLDVVLRTRAKKNGKSLNEVLVDALAIGAGVSSTASFDDLNWFVGNKSLDSSFDNAIKWLDAAPRGL